ncbi:MAG TPA: ubiquinol-cytochrome c reductase cytochrome b subunit [Acidimicrobiales bacterium]|nr:ubiquinol-cytochrome c reductase cytochrome b subunit [Acidimicrobiales bacterium]
MLARIGRWFDDRLGASRFGRSALDKVFPDHWSFMLGEIAMYCFVVLVLTGVYLTFFFNPSAREVTYHGSYGPLNGVTMSEAYRSTIRLSFDVRAGLVFRQIHHWAALVFAAAVVTHLCRIFFTGAFRRPRELNWIIGVTLLILVIFNGFTGYSLPDDLLSGTGLRIAYSIALAVPVVGTWAAFLVFGGEFPSPALISRLFVVHILLVPLAIMGLLGAHLAIIWRQKHTQFPGRGRVETNVVGSRLWPTYTARSVGLFAGVLAVLCALAGLVQINPVWLYGPFEAPAVSTAAQPDWYMGWLEGALRIMPAWRPSVLGFRVSELFWPGVLLPGITFGLLYLWPFLEARFTGDHAEHHLLDHPRDRPLRTAIGAGVLAFYIVLLFAGSQDILAQHLGVSIPPVTNAFRVGVFVVPLLVALVTRKICHDLQGATALEREKGESTDERRGAPTPTAVSVSSARSGAPNSPKAGRRGGVIAAIAGAASAVVGFLAGRRVGSRTRTVRIAMSSDRRRRRKR